MSLNFTLYVENLKLKKKKFKSTLNLVLDGNF